MSISYYATVPSWVLSHTTLSYGEKLMCALLSAMSQRNGYCYATNEVLSEALATSEGSVKYILSNLDKAGVIAIHNKKTKKAGNRQIRLVFAEQIEAAHGEPEAPQPPRNSVEDAFDRFYEIYPRREKKIPALKMFKSKKLHQRIDELIRATHNYASRVADTDKQFIMLPSTYLNNQIWEEYLNADEDKKISNGAADVPSDPYDRTLERLAQIARKLFASGGHDALESADITRYDFDEREMRFIESAGGLCDVLRGVLDGDFKERNLSAWEGSQ